MILVQQYLEIHSLRDLEIEHGIYASLSKSKKKISLNYDMIETKESDVLSWDCRGLILSRLDLGEFPTISDKLDKETIPGMTRVIGFPFRRFFNYGQGAVNINLDDPELKVYEKLDGTLCIIYNDPTSEQWCVATRSSPDADIVMNNDLFTFRALFEKALFDTCAKSFSDFTSHLDKQITYCFELCTLYNQVVVKHNANRITLLGARNVIYRNSSYHDQDWLVSNEIDISQIEIPGIPNVKSHNLKSIDDIVAYVNERSPSEQEGVVVKDSNFNRVKIKSIAYGIAHRARDTLSTSMRNCLELIILGIEDDVIPYLPEDIVKNLYQIKRGLNQIIKEHDKGYNDILAGLIDPITKNLPSKKDFALAVKKQIDLWSAPLFMRFDKKSLNMRDFIDQNKKDGAYPNSFLDKVLELINSVSYMDSEIVSFDAGLTN